MMFSKVIVIVWLRILLLARMVVSDCCFSMVTLCFSFLSSVDPIRYITEFQWDHAKYPTKQSLKNLSEIISKATTHIESELKLRSQSYNSVKQNLETLEKKERVAFVV